MGKFTAQQYKDKLDLAAHVEGGFYKQTYKSTDIVKPEDKRYKGETRNAGTMIYFLLEGNNFSEWHTLKSDETWLFHDGCSTLIHIIDPQTKKLTTQILGNPIEDENASFQVIIKAGQHFAAEVKDKDNFSLASCSVSPGFEYEDFELMNRKSFTYQYPEHKEIIERLTRVNKVDNEKILDISKSLECKI